MTQGGNTVIENATVVIIDNIITSINENIPDSALTIDGKNKWLIPGLIDMHVHALADINFNQTGPTKGANFFIDDQDFMTLFIANGVTTIFDLNSRVEHIAQRNKIIKGEIIGPRMALAALINGGAYDGSGKIANTASEGRQTVRLAKADGYGFIKVYSQLNKETFTAVLQEANKQRIKVVGHIPNVYKGKIEDALLPNFSMVAHAEEFTKHTTDYSERDAHYFAQIAKKSGVWLIPTLTVIERSADQARSLDSIRNLPCLAYVHPLFQNKWLTSNKMNQGTSPARIAHLERTIQFNNMIVKAFKKEGVPIVAGTDAGCSGVVWGFSLHDELELLVKAGLTNEEALNSATRLPATWLEIDDIVGTVEPGKYADLILLDANPLENIYNTRKIAGVFVNGKWIDKIEIEQALHNLSLKNSKNINKYEWNKRKEP